MKKSAKPIVLAGAGLILAVIVVLMFLSGSPKSGDKEQIKNMEGRLKSMEEKLAKLEWIDTGLARLDRKEKEIASISERMVQMEAALNKKVDQLSKEAAKPLQSRRRQRSRKGKRLLPSLPPPRPKPIKTSRRRMHCAERRHSFRDQPQIRHSRRSADETEQARSERPHQAGPAIDIASFQERLKLLAVSTFLGFPPRLRPRVPSNTGPDVFLLAVHVHLR